MSLLSLAVAGLGMAQCVPFNTGEWEPFTSEKLPNKGCATELVVAICRAGGIEASFLEEELRREGIGIEIVNSLDSAARMLRSGRVDFMVDEETVVYGRITAKYHMNTE